LNERELGEFYKKEWNEKTKHIDMNPIFKQLDEIVSK
jgi:hypothetical protein